MDGSATLKIPIDDTFEAQATAYNLQGNQYKKIADKRIAINCEQLYNESYREHYEDFNKFLKYPIPWKTCPMPNHTNEIKNYFLQDYCDILPPYVPGSEKWKIEARLFKDGVELGGYNWYGILRNERSILAG